MWCAPQSCAPHPPRKNCRCHFLIEICAALRIPLLSLFFFTTMSALKDKLEGLADKQEKIILKINKRRIEEAAAVSFF